MSKASNTGLLPDEQLVMDLLVGAWNGFVALPVQHVSDIAEVQEAIHRLQHILGMRVVRREHEGWINEEKEKQ